MTATAPVPAGANTSATAAVSACDTRSACSAERTQHAGQPRRANLVPAYKGTKSALALGWERLSTTKRGTKKPMSRIRQQNVTAAQWSSNGEALGSTDLTLPENDVFGANVFSEAVQRERLSDSDFEKFQATLAGGEALDAELAD